MQTTSPTSSPRRFARATYRTLTTNPRKPVCHLEQVASEIAAAEQFRDRINEAFGQQVQQYPTDSHAMFQSVVVRTSPTPASDSNNPTRYAIKRGLPPECAASRRTLPAPASARRTPTSRIGFDISSYP
jgi:hypothetical protein